jgi:hypothetical protein
VCLLGAPPTGGTHFESSAQLRCKSAIASRPPRPPSPFTSIHPHARGPEGGALFMANKPGAEAGPKTKTRAPQAPRRCAARSVGNEEARVTSEAQAEEEAAAEAAEKAGGLKQLLLVCYLLLAACCLDSEPASSDGTRHALAGCRLPLPDPGPVLGPLGSAACRLSVWGPKFSLWGPKFSATCGARGMFRLNESTATTRGIKARTVATPGRVVAARPHQLWSLLAHIE